MRLALVVLLIGLSKTLPAMVAPADSALKKAEVHSLKEWFDHGTVHGNIRSYFMGTINQGPLDNHYAKVLGGSLAYHSANLKGFEVGVKALAVFKLLSSDLADMDENSLKLPKYERQLLDWEDPHNHHDMDRVDELYLRYRWKNNYVQVGRMEIKTPLVNPQDGRMKPYGIQGLWSKVDVFSNTSVYTGVFNAAAPRSIVQWYKMEDLLGTYSQMAHSNKPEFLAIGGIIMEKQHLQFQYWNFWMENTFHTSWTQADASLADENMELGLQWVHQDGLSAKGLNTYMHQDQHNNVYAIRLGYHLPKNFISINYLYADENGDFTFPRELGREQFYTTIPRLRIEGLQNTHVTTLKTSYNWHDLQVEAGLGHVVRPSFDQLVETRICDQLDVDVEYQFHDFLKGMDIRLLYVFRKPWFDVGLSEAYYQYNFHHFNLITNIKF